ncbi:hypothetical protein RIF29_20375 [Crotalaria pallida]|uniref:Uncharacterized protein n=1 Tax=Crotalaria pallida TaxID=3830 RepID=A0AAN9I699_CROPI
MAISPGCPRCGAANEMILHCLRDCGKSMDLWLQFGFGNQDFMSSERWRNMDVLGTERWGNEQVSRSVQSMFDELTKWCGASPTSTRLVREMGGTILDRLVRFESAPESLVPLLDDDAVGRRFLRV